MKKRITTTLVLIFGLLTATAATRSLNVSRFSGITSAMNVDIEVRVSDAYTASVTGPDDLMRFFVFEQRGEMLNIGIDKGESKYEIPADGRRLRVVLTAPVVNTIATTLSSTVTILGQMDCGRRNVVINSTLSGKISYGDLLCRNLKATVSNNGVVTIDALNAEEADIEASLTGIADIHNMSVGSVEAEASLSSEIKLTGTADDVDFEATTSATIDASGLKASEGKAEATLSSVIRCNVSGKFNSSSSLSGEVTNLQ